jgi:hypothetical protein
MEAIYRHFRFLLSIGSKSEMMRNWILLTLPPLKADIAGLETGLPRIRLISLRRWKLG